MAATWRHWRHWRDTGCATARGTCCRVQNRPTSPSALQAECAAWAWHLPLVGRRQPPPLGVKVGSGGSPLSSSLHSFARAQLRRRAASSQPAYRFYRLGPQSACPRCAGTGPHHAACRPCPGRLQAAQRLPAGRAVVAEPYGVQVHPSVEGAAWWSRPAVQTAASVARLGARPDSAEGSSSSSATVARGPGTDGPEGHTAMAGRWQPAWAGRIQLNSAPSHGPGAVNRGSKSGTQEESNEGGSISKRNEGAVFILVEFLNTEQT